VDGEEYALKTADGTLLARVKLKEGKVNVYNAKGERILHAKEKNGGIVIRDEQDRQVGTVSARGLPDSRSALLLTGLLSLPTSPQIRLLMAGYVLLPRKQL